MHQSKLTPQQCIYKLILQNMSLQDECNSKQVTISWKNHQEKVSQIEKEMEGLRLENGRLREELELRSRELEGLRREFEKGRDEGERVKQSVEYRELERKYRQAVEGYDKMEKSFHELLNSKEIIPEPHDTHFRYELVQQNKADLVMQVKRIMKQHQIDVDDLCLEASIATASTKVQEKGQTDKIREQNEQLKKRIQDSLETISRLDKEVTQLRQAEKNIVFFQERHKRAYQLTEKIITQTRAILRKTEIRFQGKHSGPLNNLAGFVCQKTRDILELIQKAEF